MSTRTPTLAEILRRAISARLEDVHTARPGEIVSYDPKTQLARVKLQIRLRVQDERGDEALEALPVVDNVPVVFPGGGGFRWTFPLQKGDPVLVVFSEVSLDRWLERGGDVDPGDVRRHHVADAVAIPGLRPKAQAWTSASSGHASIGSDTGPAVVFKDEELCLGSATPADAVALASLVLARLNELAAVFDSWVAVPNDGGAALKVLLTALRTGGWPASVASTVVKSD